MGENLYKLRIPYTYLLIYIIIFLYKKTCDLQLQVVWLDNHRVQNQ